MSGRVVVITGASSGIGRATATALAARGDRLVLAARDGDALDRLAAELRSRGGVALPVPTDVADPAAVDALAEAAEQEHGRIDAWVNNASVYAVGAFADMPPEAFARVLEVNLLGVVYGSRAALAAFRRQERGTLVNVSSLVGGLAGPFVSAYATSKWAVRGLTHALHEELRDQPGIHVACVRPAGIDTPIFRYAGNWTGRPVTALRPTYPPEQVADAIVGLLDRPRREVVVGRAGVLLDLAHRVAPAAVDRLFTRRARQDLVGEGRAPCTDGNLYEPDRYWRTASGGWPTGGAASAPLAVVGGVLVAGMALRALR